MDCTVRKKDRRAEWSVQKARTEAVRRGEKIQFDGFYLTRGHYSSGATFHDAKTGKIADLHVAVIWLQLPEFLSTFLYYLNFEVPEGFK